MDQEDVNLFIRSWLETQGLHKGKNHYSINQEGS